MAKNTKSSVSSLIRSCSYFALVIAAGLFLFNGIVSALDLTVLTTVASVLSLIGKVLLAIGIGFPAYDYTAGKSKVWRIVFWIALVVYIVGCVLG